MHLLAFRFLSYLSQQHLGLYFAPSSKPSEQGQGITIDGALQELMLEEQPNLLQPLVLRPCPNRRRLFMSFDIDEAGILQQIRILRKHVKFKTCTSRYSIELGLANHLLAVVTSS